MKQLALHFIFFCFFAGSAFAETKPALDKSCDSNFIESVSAKSDCYYENNSAACITLAQEDHRGAAVASGYFSARLLDSLVNKNPEVQSKVKAATELYQAQRQTYDKVRALALKLNREKKKAYVSEVAARNTPKFDPRKIYDNPKLSPMEKHVTDIFYSDIDTELENRLKADPDPEMQAVAKRLSDHQLFDEDFLKKIQKLYPKEAAELLPYYREFHSLKPSGDSSGAFVKLNNYLAKASPTAKFIHNMVFNLRQETVLSYKGAELQKSREAVEEIENAKSATVKPKKSLAQTSAAQAAGSFLGDLVAAAAADTTTHIKDCKEYFGFSDDEFEFLTNGYWLGTAKARKHTGRAGNCDQLRMMNPATTLREAQMKFGGIPTGICKLAKGQDAHLSTLIGSTSSANATCDNFSDTNMSLKRDVENTDRFGKNRLIFEFRDDSIVYKAPMNADIIFPILN